MPEPLPGLELLFEGPILILRVSLQAQKRYQELERPEGENLGDSGCSAVQPEEGVQGFNGDSTASTEA